MNYRIFLLLLTALPFLAISQNDTSIWENRVATENSMNQFASATVDTDGNIYQILQIQDSVQMEESQMSVFADLNRRGVLIRKLNSEGKQEWYKMYQNASCSAVTITSENQCAILMGNHSQEPKVQYEVLLLNKENGAEDAKYSILPVVESYGVVAPKIPLLQFLSDGSFVIAGKSPEGILEGVKPSDKYLRTLHHFVMKFDAQGDRLWKRFFVGDTGDRIKALSSNKSDDLVIGGSINPEATFQGKPLTVIGRSDGFLWGLTSSGETKFFQPVGGEFTDQVTTLDLNDSGSIYAGGQFEHSIEFSTVESQLMIASNNRFCSFVAKFNSDGKAIWAHPFTGTSAYSAVGEVKCLDSGIGIYGRFSGTEKYQEAFMDVAMGDEIYKLGSANNAGFIVWWDENGKFQNATVPEKEFQNDMILKITFVDDNSYIAFWRKYVKGINDRYEEKKVTQKYAMWDLMNTKTIASCGEYIWEKNGEVYTKSGTYTANIKGVTHTLNLEILALETRVEKKDVDSKIELRAQQQDVFYQWMNCTNDWYPIYEENGSTFATDENGKYCFIVTSPYCKDQDTSEIFSLQFDRISRKDLERWYSYPYDNPQVIEDIEKVHLPLDGNMVKMIPFRSSEKYGFVSKDNLEKTIVAPMYSEVLSVDENGAIVKHPEGGYGMINNSGEVVIPLGFSQIFREGNVYHGTLGSLFVIDTTVPKDYRTANLHVFYDRDGKELFGEYAHEHENFQYENYAWFRYGKTYKVYDTLGTLVDSFPVDEDPYIHFLGIADDKLLKLDYNSDDFIARTIDGKEAFRFSLRTSDKIYQLSPNLYGVLSSDFNYYFLDAAGKPMPYASTSGYIGFHDSDPLFFEQEYFIVRNNEKDKSGVIDRNGKTIIPFIYDGVQLSSKNVWRCAKKGGDIVYRNEKGETKPFNKVYPLEMGGPFDRSIILKHGFQDGLLCSWEYDHKTDTLANGVVEYIDLSHYVYYDTLGNVALELDTSIYLAGDFTEGLAPALNRERELGFINKKGEWAIAPAYELTMAGAYPMPYIVTPEFVGGFAYIKSHKGYITRSGKELFEGKRMQDHYDFSH